MGKSKSEPIFLTSAGAKLIVILPRGNSKPEFSIAALTLSLDSFTAASGNPTILKVGSPFEIFTSTSIIFPAKLKHVPLNTQTAKKITS